MNEMQSDEDRERDQEESWEMRVQESARHFEYPSTPDVVNAVRSQRRPRRSVIYRRWAQVAAAIFILLAAMMAVPEIRAAVLEILRIGAVRIFQNEPTPTPSLTPRPSTTPRPTPLPTATPLQSVLDLPGETTLAAARSEMTFEILYPASLGEPDRVFAQQMDDWQVVLVWDQGAGGVPISLHVIPSSSFEAKYYPWQPTMTRVNRSPAMWFDKPHLFQFWLRSGEGIQREVQGNVLLWEAGGLTYRLESELMLDEARALAEEIQE